MPFAKQIEHSPTERRHLFPDSWLNSKRAPFQPYTSLCISVQFQRSSLCCRHSQQSLHTGMWRPFVNVFRDILMLHRAFLALRKTETLNLIQFNFIIYFVTLTSSFLFICGHNDTQRYSWVLID